MKNRPYLEIMGIALIVIVGITLYSSTLTSPWYLDDYYNIVENGLIRNLKDSFFNITEPRGIAYFTFALNYHFGEFSLPGFHIVNITIHIITSLIVYLLLKRVFRGALFLPLAGAIIFIAHPLQTQAVNYIVQRMASLCGLFFFLSIYLYTRARELSFKKGNLFSSGNAIACYITSIIFALMAGLAKENAAIIPFAIFLFDTFFLSKEERNLKKKLLYAAPYLLIPCLIAFHQLANHSSTDAGGSTLNKVINIDYWTTTESSDTVFLQKNPDNLPIIYLVTEFTVIWEYIRMLFLPTGQTLDHAYPLIRSFFTFKSIFAFTSILALLYTAFICYRKDLKPISFGIIWFFLTLSVESTIIPLDPLFEHRLYMPMFGFAVLLIELLRRTLSMKTVPIAACSIILLFSLLTWQRNILWTDFENFYKDNVHKAPHNFRAHLTLGKNYIFKRNYRQAIEEFNIAIKVNPKNSEAYNRRGGCYYLLRNFPKAINDFKASIRINPGYGGKEAYYNLAQAYSQTGDNEKKVFYYQKAARMGLKLAKEKLATFK